MLQPLRATTACRHTVSGLFHSPSGVLFTFPSRYWFTIGHCLVFSLGGWAPRIQTGFHVSRPTWDTARVINVFDYRAFTLYRQTFQIVRLTLINPTLQSRNTVPQAVRFRLVRFRSPLLTQSRLIFFPSGTEMFHFPESHFRTLFYSSTDNIL